MPVAGKPRSKITSKEATKLKHCKYKAATFGGAAVQGARWQDRKGQGYTNVWGGRSHPLAPHTTPLGRKHRAGGSLLDGSVAVVRGVFTLFIPLPQALESLERSSAVYYCRLPGGHYEPYISATQAGARGFGTVAMWQNIQSTARTGHQSHQVSSCGA